jgi:hypothetical protein
VAAVGHTAAGRDARGGRATTSSNDHEIHLATLAATGDRSKDATNEGKQATDTCSYIAMVLYQVTGASSTPHRVASALQCFEPGEYHSKGSQGLQNSKDAGCHCGANASAAAVAAVKGYKYEGNDTKAHAEMKGSIGKEGTGQFGISFAGRTVHNQRDQRLGS